MPRNLLSSDRAVTLARIQMELSKARLSATDELIAGSLRQVAESQKLLHPSAPFDRGGRTDTIGCR
jgi:hypothetical protein